MQVASPLRFIGEPMINAEAECHAVVFAEGDEALGRGFQQIRPTFWPPRELRNPKARHYDLSFRIETDRPEDAVKAEVQCRMA